MPANARGEILLRDIFKLPHHLSSPSGLVGDPFFFFWIPIGVGNDEQRLDSGYDHVRMTVGVYTLNDSFDFLKRLLRNLT